MFVLQVYKGNDYNVKFPLLQLPINGLKTRRCAFVFCPKQGNKNEGVVLNRVCVLELFYPKESQDQKPSAAHLHPNIARVPPSPRYICVLVNGQLNISINSELN